LNEALELLIEAFRDNGGVSDLALNVSLKIEMIVKDYFLLLKNKDAGFRSSYFEEKRDDIQV